MKNLAVLILFLSVPLLTIGCGSTKPYYNPNEIALSPGKSRIVFTREGEALGAAVKINVFEYGKNIDSNGIISFRKNVDKHYPENIKLDLLWFDHDLVKYISKGPGSKEGSDLQNKDGEFMQGDLLLTCNNYNDNNDYSFSADKSGKIELFNDDSDEVKYDYKYKYQIQTNIKWVLNEMDVPIKEQDAKIAEIIQSIRNEDVEPITCKVNVKDGFEVVDTYNADCYKLRHDSDIISTVPFDEASCVLSFVSNENKFLDLYQIEDFKMIGTLKVGQTIVWDREPGQINVGIFDYSGGRIFSKKLTLDGGVTYYIRYDASIMNKPHIFLTDIVE